MDLRPRATPDAEVSQVNAQAWKFTLPSGPAGRYRWAQLDDYLHRKRGDFLWQPPFRLKLRSKVSDRNVPGTWGFGLWNDPFSFSLGLKAASRRLPSLPNAAWFFFAGVENYLSLKNDLPANGFLAAVFSSPLVPSPLLGLSLPFMPLILVPAAARLVRRLAGSIIREDSHLLPVAVTEWHEYCLEWEQQAVRFHVDGEQRFYTEVVPKGRMGLVLWVDNQFAAFPPDGKIRTGTLRCDYPVSLEIADFEIQPGSLF